MSRRKEEEVALAALNFLNGQERWRGERREGDGYSIFLWIYCACLHTLSFTFHARIQSPLGCWVDKGMK